MLENVISEYCNARASDGKFTCLKCQSYNDILHVSCEVNYLHTCVMECTAMQYLFTWKQTKGGTLIKYFQFSTNTPVYIQKIDMDTIISWPRQQVYWSTVNEKFFFLRPQNLVINTVIKVKTDLRGHPASFSSLEGLPMLQICPPS